MPGRGRVVTGTGVPAAGYQRGDRPGGDDAYHLLADYTIGGVLVELSRRRVAASGGPSGGPSGDTSEDADTMRAFAASLPGEDFPHFVRLSGLLVKADDEESFAFGLDRLLAGISSDLTE